MQKNRENRQITQEKFAIIKQNNDPSAIQEAAHHFLNTAEQLDDPRTRNCPYPLREILFLAAVAYLCGAESDQVIATFGNAQIDQISTNNDDGKDVGEFNTSNCTRQEF